MLTRINFLFIFLYFMGGLLPKSSVSYGGYTDQPRYRLVLLNFDISYT